jgi:hypothetical protein
MNWGAHLKGLKALTLVGMVLVLAISLLLTGITISGQSPVPPELRGEFPDGEHLGHVVDISEDGTSFTISTNGQDQVTINVNEDTDYVILGLPAETLNALSDTLEAFLGEGNLSPLRDLPDIISGAGTRIQIADFDDLAIGDIVNIDFESEEGAASDVLIIRFLDIQRVRGEISAVDESSITIMPENGEAVTINWDQETRFLLRGVISVEVGQVAGVIYNETTSRALFVVIRTGTVPSPTATLTPPASPLTRASP